jgi:hypothetical protein
MNQFSASYTKLTSSVDDAMHFCRTYVNHINVKRLQVPQYQSRGFAKGRYSTPLFTCGWFVDEIGHITIEVMEKGGKLIKDNKGVAGFSIRNIGPEFSICYSSLSSFVPK